MLVRWFLRALKLLKGTKQAIGRVSMGHYLWFSFNLRLLYTRHFTLFFLRTLIVVYLIVVRGKKSLPKDNMLLLILLLGVELGEWWDYANWAQISLQKAIFDVWLVSYLLSWLLFHQWYSLVERVFYTLTVVLLMDLRSAFRQICLQEYSRFNRCDASLISRIIVA